MPGARLELAQGFNSPTDFKSVASADSAIRAIFLMKGFKKMEARGGIEPPHIGFADRCITTLLPRLVQSFRTAPDNLYLGLKTSAPLIFYNASQSATPCIFLCKKPACFPQKKFATHTLWKNPAFNLIGNQLSTEINSDCFAGPDHRMIMRDNF